MALDSADYRLDHPRHLTWPAIIRGRSEYKRNQPSLSGSRKLSPHDQNWQLVSGEHLCVAQLLPLYLGCSSIIFDHLVVHSILFLAIEFSESEWLKLEGLSYFNK